MANRFYENVASLVQGTLARAEAVESKHDAVENGFLLVANEMNRSIRFTDGTPGESNFQLASTAAQRAGRVLGFNSVGAPEVISGTFNWRGNWAPGIAYAINDTVRAPESLNFSLYVVTTAHTSAGSMSTDISANRLALAVDLQELQRFIRKFRIVTSSQSLVAGDDVFVDVSGGSVTLTLPASPVITDQPITVCHAGGNVVSSNITIARNGKLIMGLAEDMTVNTPNASFELAFMNDALGWRLVKGC